MNATEEAGTEPKIGSRVHVLNADRSKELGYGTYMGEVPFKDVPDEPAACVAVDESIQLTEAEQAEVSAMVEQLMEGGATTPKIVLDSGEIIFGFQCWWREIDDDDTREQHWTCEKCKATGSVKYQLHGDVMSVVYLIEDDHKRVSPDCDQPVSSIRALNANVIN
ncbi:hypothetical protein HYW59_02820 [Candidatus Kaiserbacteria bacterium]|nr:hypothetical protein [Candidatus Kaiserbacteria bacterium]